MKRKKFPKRTPEEQARYDETTRRLQELILKYRARAQEAERRASS